LLLILPPANIDIPPVMGKNRADTPRLFWSFLVLSLAGAGVCLAQDAAALTEAAAGGAVLGHALRFLGRFHVLVVHFPIALVSVAVAADAGAVVLRREWVRQASRFCLVLGAAGALLAASLGWLAAEEGVRTEAQSQILQTHRWLGVSGATWAVVACGLMALSRRGDRPALALAYRAALYIAGALVAVAGHFGGTLIYGRDHLTW
jgi:uncharacterized membrane protein